MKGNCISDPRAGATAGKPIRMIVTTTKTAINNNSHNNNMTIAVENLGSFDLSTSSFLSDLGSKIRTSSGEDKETSYLFQRISVLIQRFNSVLLHDSFIKDGPDQ